MTKRKPASGPELPPGRACFPQMGIQIRKRVSKSMLRKMGTLLRFLGSVAILPPIMAARMVASSDALQDCKCV